MGLRRFVNLVVGNYERGIYSLRRLDRSQFFYPTREAAASNARDLPIQRKVQPPSYFGAKGRKKKQAASSSELESIRPPPPLLSVRPSSCPRTYHDQPKLQCFSLSGSKIFFADSGARILCYDTESRCVITTPNLHAPKNLPFSISVPSPGGDCDGSLYIMESTLHPHKSFQFEALVCRHRPTDRRTDGKTWHCDTLPLPPYVHDPAYERASIFSYAVVGDAICISAIGVGTYCFDTVSRTWSRAGDWVMPFFGKAEYVPDLKLWFGISANNNQLPCAADLSPVVRGHPPAPEQGHVWADPDLPEEWRTPPHCSAEIVSLGSGRFCITNFYETMQYSEGLEELLVDQQFAVFTGLEVINGNANGGDGDGNGKGKCGLRMIKHKSRRWRLLDTSIIESVL